MTRQSTKQRGVTLVEVTLTLAISTLLVTTILAGRNSVRSTAQFSDGVERIKEQILLSKSNANTGKNQLGDGASFNGGSNAYLLLGESIRFRTTANTTMQTANIMCRTAGNLLCGTTVTKSSSSVKNFVTPWNIRYTGYAASGDCTSPTVGELTLLFSREDTTGTYKGAWYPAELKLGSADNKVTVFANQTPVTLCFASIDGRKASVEVNPDTGTVTRKIL